MFRPSSTNHRVGPYALNGDFVIFLNVQMESEYVKWLGCYLVGSIDTVLAKNIRCGISIFRVDSQYGESFQSFPVVEDTWVHMWIDVVED